MLPRFAAPLALFALVLTACGATSDTLSAPDGETVPVSIVETTSATEVPETTTSATEVPDTTVADTELVSVEETQPTAFPKTPNDPTGASQISAGVLAMSANALPSLREVDTTVADLEKAVANLAPRQGLTTDLNTETGVLTVEFTSAEGTASYCVVLDGAPIRATAQPCS